MNNESRFNYRAFITEAFIRLTIKFLIMQFNQGFHREGYELVEKNKII